MAPLFSQDLSRYNRYILDKIIQKFPIDRKFNIYTMVEEAVLYKCILPSQNEVVMDTYYSIKEYLVTTGFVTEQQEMSSYTLTEKGRELIRCGTLRRYEQRNAKKNFLSLFTAIFKIGKHKGLLYKDLAPEYYE